MTSVIYRMTTLSLRTSVCFLPESEMSIRCCHCAKRLDYNDTHQQKTLDFLANTRGGDDATDYRW